MRAPSSTRGTVGQGAAVQAPASAGSGPPCRVLEPAWAATLPGSHLTPAASGHSQVPPLELALAPGARMHSRFPGRARRVALTVGEEARQVEDLPPQHIGPQGGGHRLMTHLPNQQRQKQGSLQGSAQLPSSNSYMAGPISWGISPGTPLSMPSPRPHPGPNLNHKPSTTSMLDSIRVQTPAFSFII